MAKKATKNNKTIQVETPELVTEVTNTTTDNSNVPSYETTTTATDKNIDLSYVSLTPNGTHISELNITELIALEKACNLVCRRFETVAQLDFNNNFKFNCIFIYIYIKQY
jgi:hypothetical protein